MKLDIWVVFGRLSGPLYFLAGDPSFLSPHFRSEDCVGLGEGLKAGFNEDTDGDGIAFWEDRCPLTAQNGADDDSDGFGNNCDPAPQWYSPYVAGGATGFPATTAPSYSGPLWSKWPGGGFLDTDGDNAPEGADSCPFNHGGGVSRNSWAEDWTWPGGSMLNGVTNWKRGLFQRGDLCDPYPIAVPEWPPEREPHHSGGSHFCRTPGFTSGGEEAIGIRQVATLGISNNDPRVLDPSYQTNKPAPRTFWGQTHRCACRDPGVDCLGDPLSDCYQEGALAQTSEEPQYFGRGWRPIDRTDCTLVDRDNDSFCPPYPIAASYLSATAYESLQTSTTWAWKRELDTDLSSNPPAGWKKHFGDNDFRQVEYIGDPVPPGDPSAGSSTAYQSNHRYVLWTFMGLDVGSDRFEAPGPLNRPLKPGEGTLYKLGDPEASDSRLLAGNLSPESRRLRSGYDPEPRELMSSWSVFDGSLHCPKFDIKYFAHYRWPETYIRWPEKVAREPDLLYGVSGPLIEQAMFFDLASATYQQVSLLPELATSWVATAPGAAVPIAPLTAQTATRQAVASLDVSVLPDLLRVERPGSRWALLRVHGESGAQPAYTIILHGSLGIELGPDATLVADALGQTAALVDPASGKVLGWEPTLQTWVQSTARTDGLLAREGAAMALLGSALHIVGGTTDGEIRSDAWLIDAHGNNAQRIEGKFPPRRDAQLVMSNDGRSLLLAGGRDAAGRYHDDVWSIPTGVETANRSVRLLRPDTADPSRFVAAPTIISGTWDGGDLQAWTIREEENVGVVANLTRTAAGWFSKETEAAISGRCDVDDADGGAMCALGKDWWSEPGARGCAGTPRAGECVGGDEQLLMTTSIRPGSKPVQVLADGATVWILTQHALERWSFGHDGAARLLQRRSLPAQGHAMALSSPQLLVATQAGVQLVRPDGDTFSLSAPLELCGRPLSCAAMGRTSFAVSTTLGLSVVNVREGQLVVSQSLALLPLPNGTGMVVPLPSGDAMDCRRNDTAFRGSLWNWVKHSSPVAAVSPSRLLAARGEMVFDIDLSRGGDAELTGTLKISPVSTLRLDDSGTRAYGRGILGGHKTRPTIDLRGGRPVMGLAHDIESWVSRHDAGELSVRINEPWSVEVVRVAR